MFFSHRPPSTAMTLGIPQAESGCLLEDRKGSNMHILHLVTGKYKWYWHLNILIFFTVYALLFYYDCSIQSQRFCTGLFLMSRWLSFVETPKKSVSVPEELVVYGHSRTSSYASQKSKISGIAFGAANSWFLVWHFCVNIVVIIMNAVQFHSA